MANNSSHPANGKHVAGVHRQANTQHVVVQESDAHNAIFARNPKMGVIEIQEITEKLDKVQLLCSTKCALNIEVIDDTALIGTSIIGKGKLNKNGKEIKKGKNRKRRGKCGGKKKNVEERIQNHSSVEKEEVFAVYSREEMEALRFVDLDYQKKKWTQVYCGLGAAVAAEYDGLVSSPMVNKKHGFSSFSFDRPVLFQKSADLDAVAAIGKRNHPNIFVH